jgi:uncharacterized protein
MNIRTSPLVTMASEAKRPTPWWLAWIIAAIIIIAGGAGGDALGSMILGNPAKTDTRYQFIEIFSFGGSLLLLWLWVRFKEGRKFSSVGFRGPKPIGKLLLGFVVGAVMMSIGVAIPWATGHLASDSSSHTNLGTAALVPVLGLVFVFLWQASTEEAITRGYMLQVGGRDLAPWFAILGSSIFFAVIHLDFSPVPLLNITLYAVFACFVALQQGGLWLICGIHAGWNFFQGNIYGVPVSGNPEASSILGLSPTAGSSDLLTGGSFGIEASLSGSVVLVIALVIAIAAYRRKDAERAAQVPEPMAA